MSYRRTLSLRWSREDRLAVLVIAVTAAFLVGTVLFVVAAGDRTAEIAAGLESPGSATYYGSTGAAAAAADPGAVVLPVAEVTGPAGVSTYAVAVPPGTNRTFGTRRLTAAGRDRYPATLSGGEKQRVAIARALVNRPAVVLADEPTGQLDPDTAASVLELLFELQAETDTALVVVSHDRALADRFERRYRLADGRLEPD